MTPKKTTKPSDIPQEVPMFLRKTYHMIDSCDATVACWSEDGETFVVKDPSKFESEIIPQFFKHSKFTSFVRQLNFYSFRKIKYVDTIRLDPKLEAETANFWRFRHEKFQRGKPHLLTEIKRMTASQTRAAAEKAAKAQATAQAMAVPSSSSVIAAAASNNEMKTEIDTLKKRLEEMNKNMSELTSMVQKVSLSDTTTTSEADMGNKRKKVEIVLPEQVHSSHHAPHHSKSNSLTDSLPDATLDLLLEGEDTATMDNMSSMFPSDPMEMDAVSSALGLPVPLPSQQPNARTTSSASNMTDSDFVDQLFDAFGEAGSDGEGDNALPEPAEVMSSSTPSYHHHHTTNKHSQNNRPDPELMDRLSEALAVLPKDMQEQIVNRLIASITANTALDAKATVDVVPAPYKKDDGGASSMMMMTPQEGTAIGMPLAAATLASLLSYYSTLVKDKEAEQANKPHVKPIPVIPCHA